MTCEFCVRGALWPFPQSSAHRPGSCMTGAWRQIYTRIVGGRSCGDVLGVVVLSDRTAPSFHLLVFDILRRPASHADTSRSCGNILLDILARWKRGGDCGRGAKCYKGCDPHYASRHSSGVAWRCCEHPILWTNGRASKNSCKYCRPDIMRGPLDVCLGALTVPAVPT